MNKLTIYTDGGARGNPGPAGIGVVIWRGHDLVWRHGECIGHATNNQAEYRALICGLKKAKALKAEEVEFFLDSELVVKQARREFKIKDKDLGSLFVQVWNLVLGFKKVTFHHIPREKNKEADKLVNQALDAAR